ncbi:MAG: serpin family protein [Planctomycetota bacterium]|jgi:serpin B
MRGMHKILFSLVLVGFLLAATRPNPPVVKKTDKQKIVEGNNRFALDLYGQLREEKGNIFFSPYSISTALAMTYAGAKGNTAKQMADVLKFELDNERLHPAFSAIINQLNAGGKKGAYQLSVANALWGQKGEGFLAEFIDLLNSSYRAGLNEVDFVNNTEAARKTINDWVEKQTQDKIKELIKRNVLNSSTVLVLTNAIYFKGSWALQFKKQQTRDEDFTLADGKKAKVPMMHQQARFKYMAGDDFQVLELPYVGDDLSMVVFLPEKADGLRDFERKLNDGNLAKWLSKLRKQEVIVVLPKFKMVSEFELAKVLNSMGMVDAFNSQRADFSGMNGRRDLFISKVLHKAFVEVNEEGTEAAAATAVMMTKGGPRLTVFRADHPFLFLIRDMRSGSILFIGRIHNPSSR